MVTQRNSFVLGKQVHHSDSHIPSSDSHIPSIGVLAAVALILLGAGVIFALPEDSDDESPIASASANAPGSTASADDSLCDKQAWPYIDQRCAQRVEAARGMRQVRIVTDKGHSVTTVTPVPIVEQKPKPAPQTPVVAQVERPIGPPAAPTAAEPTPPQPEKVAVAPQQPAPAPQKPAPQAAPAPAATVQAAVAPANPPAATQAMARETPDPSANNTRNAAIAPAAASPAPMAPGVDAFADAPAKKSKSARAAEKIEKRDAKRRKAIEEDVPEDVVAAVKSLPAGGQNGRRARGAVPDEVLRAVEEAAADAGGRGRRIVTIGSPNGGQRMYLVPREEAGRW